MTFKILSLDGGGIRGVLAAGILQEMERQLGPERPLHQYFDMIAGTSTGSILAAGLALGKNCQELIHLYQAHGEDIFPPPPVWHKLPFVGLFKALFSPHKYSNKGLIRALRQELGETKIGQVETPIVLMLAYDTLYRNTTLFTNYHPHLGARWYDDTPLWEICVSSAAAPTFFPPYELRPYNVEKFGNWRFPHIDGGVSANNPDLPALSQAIKISHSAAVDSCSKQAHNLIENIKLEEIAILSIGTGNVVESFQFETVNQWRALNWAQHLSDIFVAAPGEIYSTVCQQLMGGAESTRYLRLQFELNENFRAKADETFRDTRELVAAAERINRFTGKHLSEKLDDGSPGNIAALLEVARLFVEQGHTFETRNQQGPLVKDAIAAFIQNNP